MLHLLGLGNPGAQYDRTRHNVGRDQLIELVQAAGGAWHKDKLANALVAECVVAGQPISCYLPETFMNKSGDIAAYLAEKQGVRPSDLLGLHDDLDLGIGDIKISRGRGDGGNNGLKSIIGRLGSKDFARVRIGIAPRHWWTGVARRPQAGAPLERFVLQRFTRSERTQLADLTPTIQAVIETVVEDGVDAAMNHYN